MKKIILILFIFSSTYLKAENLELFEAIRQANVEKLEELFKNGSLNKRDVNQTGKEGFTPLQQAARLGHSKIAEVLIKNGAAPNARDQYNNTPLHEAARYGNGKTAEVLIKNGADPNARNNVWQAAAHIAAIKGYSKTLDSLVKNGAFLNIKDASGLSPIHELLANTKTLNNVTQYAMIEFLLENKDKIKDPKERHIIEAFLHKDTNLNMTRALVKNRKGEPDKDKNLKMFEGLVQERDRADLNAKDSSSRSHHEVKKPKEKLGKAAISKASTAYQRFLEQLRKLMRADLNAKDASSRSRHEVKKIIKTNSESALAFSTYTPLPYLHNEIQNQPDPRFHQRVYSDLNAFIKRADPKVINQKDHLGFTPLHIAAARGFDIAVGNLIKRGADVNAKANGGSTPLMQALENNELRVVKDMLKLGKIDLSIRDFQGKLAIDYLEHIKDPKERQSLRHLMKTRSQGLSSSFKSKFFRFKNPFKNRSKGK